MGKKRWFHKVITAIVALAVVCQMSFSGTVVYAAWDDAEEWDVEEWEIAEDEDSDDESVWDNFEEEEEDDEDEFVEPVLSSTSLTLKKGSVVGLAVSGEFEYIEWSSSNKSVAKIDSNGAVKAVKAGTAVITAKVTCFRESDEDFCEEEYEDEDFFYEDDTDEDEIEEDEMVEGVEETYTLTCKVKVIAPTIKISANKLTIKKGKNAKLKITGTSEKVTWKSSNKKVATVNKGVVKAKKVGKTTITAKVSGKTLKCSVAIQKK